MRIRLAIALVVSGLAGSGAAQPGDTPATTGAAAQAAGACALLTPKEIKQALGRRVPPLVEQVPPSEERLAGGGSECFYPGLTVQLNAFTAAKFADTRKRYASTGRTTFQPEGGLGDEAYFYEQDAGKDSHAVGYFVRSGRNVLTVTIDVNPPETGDSRRRDALAVAKAAVAKLR